MENFAALAAVGAERVTANELRKLGLAVLETGYGRVRFQADAAGAWRALLGIRTADRILWEAARFPAGDFDALFEGVRAAPLEAFVPRGMGLRVAKVRTAGSKLRSVPAIQGMVHKAAAERLCAKFGMRRLPEGPDTANAEIRLYLERDTAQLLLDISGEPLSRRGYRTEGGIAPLRETAAAALLFLASWRRKFPLYDPFCGSGTIVAEAALYAWDAAPGLGRSFALSGMAGADPALERSIREEFLGRVNFERTVRIAGSDADPEAVSIARRNLARAYSIARGRRRAGGLPGAGVSGTGGGTDRAGSDGGAALPVFSVMPMEKARPGEDTRGEPGFLITNPPYGRRLGGEEEAEANYGAMLVLARNFPGWKLGVLTGREGFESSFGRKADSCREITQGAAGTFFFQYESL